MVYVSRFFVPASSGISAGDLEVGKIVRLNEKGTPVDYLVVNQGIRRPSEYTPIRSRTPRGVRGLKCPGCPPFAGRRSVAPLAGCVD